MPEQFIYPRTQANFTGNTFQNDKFEHYIQAKGSIGQPIDLQNNTFQQGDNDLVIIDVAATPFSIRLDKLQLTMDMG